jgi:hypothetical protein
MYIGGRLRYNEVVPVCAVEAEKLSGGACCLLCCTYVKSRS